MSNHRLHLVARLSAERLTPAEQDVLELAGLRTADIALVRGSRPATVKAQKLAIMRKLSADTWTGAALEWQRRKAS